jgi:alkylation response protein AidB-like acyl-CoA dehydrogenase
MTVDGSSLVERLKRFVADEAPEMPLPGLGFTDTRWLTLAGLGREDTVLGRLAEGHADAVAILAELGGPAPSRGQIWGVWAAEPPSPVLEAAQGKNGWKLTGVKPWCSGAHIVTNALVTARVGDRSRLFAVDMTQDWCSPIPNTWHAVGMSRSDSGTVRFDGANAVPVGEIGSYVERPGFWHGGLGVAAVWFGSACAVADTLHAAAQSSSDPHTMAHLGAVAASLGAASAALTTAAAEIDADPTDSEARGSTRARIVRAIVESAATDTIDRVGRALGAAPLCANGEHARRVADLTVFLRQSHAERDLAALGQEIAKEESPW